MEKHSTTFPQEVYLSTMLSSTLRPLSGRMSDNNAGINNKIPWMEGVFMDELQRRIQIARGEIPADRVLRNAKLVNVCSGECYPADVAIADGRVLGISTPGSNYR